MLRGVRQYSHFVDEETQAEKDVKWLAQDHTAKVESWTSSPGVEPWSSSLFNSAIFLFFTSFSLFIFV